MFGFGFLVLGLGCLVGSIFNYVPFRFAHFFYTTAWVSSFNLFFRLIVGCVVIVIANLGWTRDKLNSFLFRVKRSKEEGEIDKTLVVLEMNTERDKEAEVGRCSEWISWTGNVRWFWFGRILIGPAQRGTVRISVKMSLSEGPKQ